MDAGGLGSAAAGSSPWRRGRCFWGWGASERARPARCTVAWQTPPSASSAARRWHPCQKRCAAAVPLASMPRLPHRGLPSPDLVSQRQAAAPGGCDGV
jgi:hypothetical protein